MNSYNKKQMIRYLSTIPIFLFCCFVLKAQNDDFEISLVAEGTGNFVALRWAPMNIDTWEWCLENGYVLERMTVKDQNGDLTGAQKQTSRVTLGDPIFPIPEADWETLADNDEVAGVAAGAIYAEEFQVAPLANSDIMTAYNTSRARENRFSFGLFAADQAFYIAEAMGLGYLDQSVETGKEYLYRVRPVNPPAEKTLKNGIVFISPDDVASIPAPQGFEGVAGDMHVVLNWDGLLNAKNYTGYNIERSDNGGASFQKINDYPVIFTEKGEGNQENVYYIDSLATNNQIYIYRIKGITPFGNESPPSETIQLTGKPAPVPARPIIQSISEDAPGRMKVNWSFPSNFNNRIDGFHIFRAPHREGPYTKLNTSILSTSTLQYIDNNPNNNNFYKIIAPDENGYELASLAALGQINDETPPAVPSGLSGYAEATGLVKLTWDENTDEDLQGYRIFMSNQDAGDFTQITTTWVIDPFFNYQINLNSLGEAVYFKILAQDYRGNYSAQSASIRVDRPDIIPPVAPVIKFIEATPEGVVLKWNESSSIDVVGHRLERKKNHEVQWETLLPLSAGGQTEYLDEEASYKYQYNYRVVAVDDADLQTNSTVMSIQPIDSGERPPIINPTGEVEIISATGGGFTGSNGGFLDEVVIAGNPPPPISVSNGQREYAVIKLQWEYTNEAFLCGIESFQIYRGIDYADQAFSIYKTVKPDDAAIALIGNNTLYEALDIEIRPGHTFYYQIVATYINGATSPVSSIITVPY